VAVASIADAVAMAKPTHVLSTDSMWGEEGDSETSSDALLTVVNGHDMPPKLESRRLIALSVSMHGDISTELHLPAQDGYVTQHTDLLLLRRQFR
jgi:hypothetical protein